MPPQAPPHRQRPHLTLSVCDPPPIAVSAPTKVCEFGEFSNEQASREGEREGEGVAGGCWGRAVGREGCCAAGRLAAAGPVKCPRSPRAVAPLTPFPPPRSLPPAELPQVGAGRRRLPHRHQQRGVQCGGAPSCLFCFCLSSRCCSSGWLACLLAWLACVRLRRCASRAFACVPCCCPPPPPPQVSAFNPDIQLPCGEAAPEESPYDDITGTTAGEP